jgi:hypothetical protein
MADWGFTTSGSEENPDGPHGGGISRKRTFTPAYFPPYNPTTIFSALDRINRIYRIEEMTAQSAEIFCLGTKGEFSSLRSEGGNEVSPSCFVHSTSFYTPREAESS